MKALALAFLLCFPAIAIAQSASYQDGTLHSWKASKDTERTYYIISGSFIYGVTHTLDPRKIHLAPGLHVHDPLNNLAPGSPVQFRTSGRWMYLLDGKKEATYSIDDVSPSQ